MKKFINGRIVCPLDGKPCDPKCPDCYQDRKDGGCVLTTAVELGAKLFHLGGDAVGILYSPDVRNEERR